MPSNEEISRTQLERVRRICTGFPETEERLSHGEPTFFVRNKVFVMFANNHHGDGRIAVWVPAPDGRQANLIAKSPEIYFRPPYVGVKGWLGIELARIGQDDLELHIDIAWKMIAPKRLQTDSSPDP